MKIKTLPSWYLTLTLVTGIYCLTILTTKQVGQAQSKRPKMISSEQMRPTTKVTLGTKRGLNELTAVLDASDCTNTSSIRKVVISIPNDLPEYIRLNEAGTTAIRKNSLIADTTSLKRNDFYPTSAPALESPQGIRGILPNGEIIRLRIRKIKEDNNFLSIGELLIQKHEIPSYEQVNQIRFFMP